MGQSMMENSQDQFNLRGLQLKQLEILKEVKRVCEKHDLTFYIMNGTCLGAVRHEGFIPWDDDIDIGMYVTDFDKFMKYQRDLDDRFFIQSIDTDPEFKTMIARVRLNGTTLIEKSFINCDIHQGIFIDIYPLFSYPSNPFKAKLMSWKSLLYRMYLRGEVPENHGRAVKIISHILFHVVPKSRQAGFVRKFHNALRTMPMDTQYVAFLFGMDVKIWSTIRYPRAWFDVPSMLRFEDIVLPSPTDWDGYLRLRYKEYMKLPPKNKQSSYHSFEFIDIENDYSIYKGKKYLIQ